MAAVRGRGLGSPPSPASCAPTLPHTYTGIRGSHTALTGHSDLATSQGGGDPPLSWFCVPHPMITARPLALPDRALTMDDDAQQEGD